MLRMDSAIYPRATAMIFHLSYWLLRFKNLEGDDWGEKGEQKGFH